MSPLVLEVNARCWLRELSDKVGRPVTLDRVPEVELESWRALGLTHIWLMGVWQSGPLARAQALASPQQRADFSEALPGWGERDVTGSPYAVADYQVLDSLGGEMGL
ncbi:MAG TPA: alpha-amylase, partial [Verrucomicrobiae bacterium]|nr:alpha-amylase [Verrucomicrobiae bacterium]